MIERPESYWQVYFYLTYEELCVLDNALRRDHERWADKSHEIYQHRPRVLKSIDKMRRELSKVFQQAKDEGG